jgi:hypothetical protein
MVAVKQNGQALQYASDELKGDPEIVMHGAAQNANALRWYWMADRCLGTKQPFRASRTLLDGGLRTYVENLMSAVFNVPKHAFIATILFGAKAAPQPQQQPQPSQATNGSDGGDGSATPCPHLCDNSGCVLSLLRPSTRLPASLSTQIKRLISEYAGVRGGAEWKVIEAAAESCRLFDKIGIWNWKSKSQR